MIRLVATWAVYILGTGHRSGIFVANRDFGDLEPHASSFNELREHLKGWEIL